MSIPFSSYKGLESQDSLAHFTRPTTSSSNEPSKNRPSQSQKAGSSDRYSFSLGPDESLAHISQPTIGLSNGLPESGGFHGRSLTSNTVGTDMHDPSYFAHSRDVSEKSLLSDRQLATWPISRPETPLQYSSPYGSSSQVELIPRSKLSKSHLENPDLPLYSEEAPAKSRRGFFGRLKDRVYAHVDPSSILHLFDCRPWFYPFTWKKYIVLFLLACIIAGIVISDLFFHWIEKSMEITRSYMLPVLIISVAAEPIIVFIILPVAIIPNIPRHEIEMNMNSAPDVESAGSEKRMEPRGPFETALIIPCHDTDHVAMKTTLDSAFPHFRPQDIYLVDNGRTRYPSHPDGNFREYIRSIHPDIVYLWSPIGSKNAAQLVGALAARNKGYKYTMTVDDDVCIPKNFSAPTEMIDEKFKAVAYPIKAMDAKCEVPLWLVAWQDVEYHLSGLSKLAEDRLCGVQFPHGAGWFVELDAFIELMEFYHPMDFIAEDCNAGLGLSKMGKGIRFDARSFLATEVPTTFFGPGLNWWKQRQKSWEMGRHGRLFAFIRHFFWSMPPKKTIQGILWHKLSFFYLICTIVIDWLRVPTIVALGRTATWWRNACLLMLFSALPPLAYNYWKCRKRPDLQIRFWAAITYPFYKQIYVLVSLFGMIRWAGFFLGGHVAPPTIKQMVRNNDDRCFWLDPRFEKNPAWLADEAEALEAAKVDNGQTTGVITPLDGKNNSKLDFELEPPRATYFSPLLISTGDESIPERHHSPRPRLSPSTAALSPPIDQISAPPSPFLLTPAEREFPRASDQRNASRSRYNPNMTNSSRDGSRSPSPYWMAGQTPRSGAQSPRIKNEERGSNPFAESMATSRRSRPRSNNPNNPYNDSNIAAPTPKPARRPGWYQYDSSTSTLVGTLDSPANANSSRRPQDSFATGFDPAIPRTGINRVDSAASTVVATPGTLVGIVRKDSDTLTDETKASLSAYDVHHAISDGQKTPFKLENDYGAAHDSANTLALAKHNALKAMDANKMLESGPAGSFLEKRLGLKSQ